MAPQQTPFVKILAGQAVTQGMIQCLVMTIDLAVKAISVPAIYKGETLRGICLDKSIAFARDSTSPAVTYLSSPDYLLHSLTQQNADRNKIREILEKLERENATLQAPKYEQISQDAPVEDFQWHATIVRPEAKNVRVMVQLDTGSVDSFVSEKIVRKAQMQRLPDASNSLYMTLNGETIEARDQVWVEWYAINQAVTRWTRCYVMPNLPVDMLIGRTHIVEYNILAINRAKAAFIAVPDASKKAKNDAEVNACKQDEVAKEAERHHKEELRTKLKPPVPAKPRELQQAQTISQDRMSSSTSETSSLAGRPMPTKAKSDGPKFIPTFTSPELSAKSRPDVLGSMRTQSEKLGANVGAKARTIKSSFLSFREKRST